MSEENKRICTNCGSKIMADAKFCINCGTKVEATVAEVSENETQVQEETPVVAAPEAEETITKAALETAPEIATPVITEEIDIHYEDEATDTEVLPQPAQYTGVPVVREESNGSLGFSIASMICGIMSILCCCLYTFSIILAIVAIVLGIVTLCGKYNGKGMAIAGIVTGGIGLFIWIIFIIAGGLALFDTDLSSLF